MRQRRNIKTATDRFRGVLQAHGQRWTGEREAILEAVASREGHFSVEQIVADVRARGHSASRATVYRALPLLVEAGVLQPLNIGEERRYETSLGHPHHDHLICKSCGTVVEFRFEAFEMLQRELAAKHGFELLHHVHELYGICAKCRAKGISGGGAPSH